MSSTNLHAYLEDAHIGQFVSQKDSIAFQYDHNNSDAAPLLLSLPRAQQHDRDAVANYLDNLLPDRPAARERWRRQRDLSSTEPFAFLAAYGEDVAGTITLRLDEQPPQRKPAPVVDSVIRIPPHG